MKKEDIKKFMEEFDLGWSDNRVYTISKNTFEKEIMERDDER